MKKSFLAAAVIALAVFAAAASAAEVKRLSVTGPDEKTSQVMCGVFQSQEGKHWSPQAFSTDLFRLTKMLKSQITLVKIELAEGGVNLAVAAEPSGSLAMPSLAGIEIEGAGADLTAPCQSAILQRPATLFRKRQLDFATMLIDIGIIEDEHRRAGFADARVTSVTLENANGEARVKYTVRPGKPYVVHGIKCEGLKEINEGELSAAIPFPNAPRWTKGFADSLIEKTQTFGREQGFLGIAATVEPVKGDGVVDLRVKVEEGPKAIINQVMVRAANDEIQNKVGKLITLNKGDTITASKLDKMRAAIEDLGEFSEVTLHPVPVRDAPAGHIDLVIFCASVQQAKEPTPAEKLYYEMMKNVIREYNNGIKSAEASGFFTHAGGEPIHFSLAIDGKQGYLKLEKNKRELEVIADNGRTALAGNMLRQAVELPRPLALKAAIYPPNPERKAPAQFHIAPGVLGSSDIFDSIIIGGARCNPAAAHYTVHAAQFAKFPPSIDKDGSLVLTSEKSITRVTLDERRLPSRIVTSDRGGNVASDITLALNRKPAAMKPFPADTDRAGGAALLGPAIWVFGLQEQAQEMSAEAFASFSQSALVQASHALVALAGGSPDKPLAALRKAAAEHPAFKLLLVETLIRGKQFAEAAALSAAPIEAPAQTGIPDVLLGLSQSLAAAGETLFSPENSYEHRRLIDHALALSGLRKFDESAAIATKLLTEDPSDKQAAEVLARAELGRNNPKAALDALKPLSEDAPLHVELYAAFAHDMLGDAGLAAAALERAVALEPAVRNLLFLQDQAKEVNERYANPASRRSLARALSKALFNVPADQKAEIAAVVNDGFILKSDVEKLAAEISARPGVKFASPEKASEAALKQITDEMLILRWASWNGIGVSDNEVIRLMRDEMAVLGAKDVSQYDQMLKQHGSSLDDRPRMIREGLLRQRSYTLVLTDRIGVDAKAVMDYYDAHPDEFHANPSAHFRMITLEFTRFRERRQAEELATALIKKLREKPDDFATVAQEYSQDPQAPKGGLWENVSKGSLIPALDDAIFAAKAGEITEAVNSGRGLHIIKVEKLEPERKISLQEATPKILRQMQEKKADAELGKWLEDFRAESHIEIF